MEVISACTDMRCRLGMFSRLPSFFFFALFYWLRLLMLFRRFVLKTKEQKAAEKALLDKSPLKTLTLEEFLESERHKLGDNLTPVTAETFAKWKKERLSKKAAEEEAAKAKEATGRAMFESGDWKASDDEDSEDDDDVFDLDDMRAETANVENEDGASDAGASDTPQSSDKHATPVEGEG